MCKMELNLKISLHCGFYLVSVKKQVYIFSVKGVSDSRKCLTYFPVMCKMELNLKISLHCGFYLVSVKKQVYIFSVKGVSDSRKCLTYFPVMCKITDLCLPAVCKYILHNHRTYTNRWDYFLKGDTCSPCPSPGIIPGQASLGRQVRPVKPQGNLLGCGSLIA